MLNHGGHRREKRVLTADLRGFSQILEESDGKDLSRGGERRRKA